MLPKTLYKMTLVVTVWTVCLTSILKAQTTDSRTNSTPLKTWAVLGDDAAIRSGLTDGLLAELSTTDMKLVERESLEQVASEQNMHLLMGNLSQESKRLGKILHADALILVQHVGKPDFFPDSRTVTTPQKIRLVLCECSQGLRLGESTFEQGPIDQKAKLMAEYVADRRKHFANGVQVIVGVSPMACRNIEHDFDHLQQRYFDIVAGRLMTIPGLALLELAEAQVVSKEFGAGEKANSRPIPVMLEWEYRVESRQNPVRVQVKARLLGSRVESLESPELPLDKVDTWLGNDLVDRILNMNPGQPLKLDDQQAILAERADYLMRLGDFSGAVQCREAFLLADPNNANQRMLAIDHLLVLANPPVIRPVAMEVSLRRFIADTVFRAATQSAVLLDHLTYLISNRLIDQSTAIALLQRMNDECRMLRGTRAHLLQTLSKEVRMVAGLDNLMSCNRRFVLQTAAKVLDLPEPQPLAPEDKQRQLAAWHNYVAGLVADDIAGHGGAIESFQYLERVVLEVVPETMPTSWEISSAITTYRKSFSPFRIQYPDLTIETVEIKVDEAAMEKWLKKLRQSPHAHLRWYAQSRAALDKLKGVSGPIPEEVQLEIERITNEIKQRPYSQVKDSYGTHLDAVLGVLERFTVTQNSTQQSTAQTIPSTSASPARPVALPSEVVAGQIIVEKIDIALSQSERERAVDRMLDFIPTGRGVDFLVLAGQVGALRDAKTYSPIHQNKIVSSAVWDGQHLWVGEKDAGIFQYRLDGTKVRHITQADGLQPHNDDLQLVVIKPNQLIVYGAIKPNDRAWIAMLSIVDEKPQWKIMHEARRPYRGIPNPKNPRVTLPNDDPTMVTRFMWSGVFQTSDRNVCFIGRQAAPLAIDIQSGKVEAARMEPFNANGTGTMLMAGGNWYRSFRTGVGQYELSAGSLQPKLKRLVVNPFTDGTKPDWIEETPGLVEYKGWLYKTGAVWYRFRPNGESVERLTSPKSIQPHLYAKTSASDHFGIVGFQWHSPFALYKITPP